MTEPNWPQYRPTTLRLTELQPEAVAGNRDPFLALTTQVKLLAAGGFGDLARKLLDFTESEYPVQRIPIGMAARLILAAIVARAADRAEAWLTTVFCADCTVRLDREVSDLPPAVIRFDASGNQARFQFSQSLFHVHTTEMLIGRWITIFPLLHRFMTSPHRINGAVDISLDDGGSVPGLAFCDYRPGYFLIPDPHYLALDQYRPLVDDFRAHAVDWDDRLKLAFWRGSTTGAPTDPMRGWRSLPRVHLAELSAEFPDLIDAGIANVNQGIDEAGAQELQARGLIRPRVERRAFLRYRYQIDIDGNTNSWDGFVMKLLSGSPVLKVASARGFRQWYYDRLVPWQHYVPVEADLSDLVEKVQWLQAHDDCARRIGESGKAFAEALATDQELDRVVPVIAAAVRAQSGGPVVDIPFRAGAGQSGTLASGWRESAGDGVSLAEPEAVMTLPMPPCLGDFVLLVDVEPGSRSPAPITVSASEQVILQQSVAERRTCYGYLPRHLGEASGMFTLAFSGGAAPASFVVHRIGLAIVDRLGNPGFIDTASSLARLNAAPPPSTAPETTLGTAGSWHLQRPSAGVSHPMFTWMGTLAYVDDQTGCIRHGPEAEVPQNLFVIRNGNLALLVQVAADGTEQQIRLRPEGPFASRDTWVPWTAGRVETLEVGSVSGNPNNHVSLRGAGLFLCADGSGRVTLSRPKRSSWEVFSFERPASKQ